MLQIVFISLKHFNRRRWLEYWERIRVSISLTFLLCGKRTISSGQVINEQTTMNGILKAVDQFAEPTAFVFLYTLRYKRIEQRKAETVRNVFSCFFLFSKTGTFWGSFGLKSYDWAMDAGFSFFRTTWFISRSWTQYKDKIVTNLTRTFFLQEIYRVKPNHFWKIIF